MNTNTIVGVWLLSAASAVAQDLLHLDRGGLHGPRGQAFEVPDVEPTPSGGQFIVRVAPPMRPVGPGGSPALFAFGPNREIGAWAGWRDDLGLTLLTCAFEGGDRLDARVGQEQYAAALRAVVEAHEHLRIDAERIAVVAVGAHRTSLLDWLTRADVPRVAAVVWIDPDHGASSAPTPTALVDPPPVLLAWRPAPGAADPDARRENVLELERMTALARVWAAQGAPFELHAFPPTVPPFEDEPEARASTWRVADAVADFLALHGVLGGAHRNIGITARGDAVQVRATPPWLQVGGEVLVVEGEECVLRIDYANGPVPTGIQVPVYLGKKYHGELRLTSISGIHAIGRITREVGQHPIRPGHRFAAQTPR